MVDASRYTDVDEGSGTVRILWGGLASTLTGILAWANIQGLITLQDVGLGGISSTISNVGDWGVKVAHRLTTFPKEGLETAFRVNAEWVGQYGAAAQALAMVEIAVFVFILTWTVTKALEVLVWGS